MYRTSVVNSIIIKSVSTSSLVAVGDADCLKARTCALALQRQVAVFFDHEMEFSHYPLFNKPFPEQSIDEKVIMHIENQTRFIKLGQLNVLGVAAASTLQVGSSSQVDLETRIKQFRHFCTSAETGSLS